MVRRAVRQSWRFLSLLLLLVELTSLVSASTTTVNGWLVGHAPVALTSGADGNLWFTEFAANQIGQITPSGVVREFLLPTPSSAPGPLTPGPDGNLWFLELDRATVGRITTAGLMTEFLVPTVQFNSANGI